MKKYSPDAVINCAAMTNVDMCETAPEKAYRINAEGARLICTAAAEAGADFVQLSTDFVFDGKGTSPYSEEDSCSPINIYGRSKLMSVDVVMFSFLSPSSALPISTTSSAPHGFTADTAPTSLQPYRTRHGVTAPLKW